MGLKEYGLKLQKLREERERFLQLIHSSDKRLARGEITKYQRNFTINSITHGMSERDYLRSIESEISDYDRLADIERSKSPAMHNILKISLGMLAIVIVLLILIIPGINRLNAQNIREFNVPVNQTYYSGDNNIYQLQDIKDAPITSLKINGTYRGEVQVYLVINDTETKYLVFNSKKYDGNIISITGNLFIMRGNPSIEGTSLNEVCDETCKIEVDPKTMYLQVIVGKDAAIRIESILYTQIIINTPPKQEKNIENIVLNDISKSVDLKGYFVDEENDTLKYTMSKISSVSMTAEGDVLMFNVSRNVQANYSGFLFVSDGREDINSNVFKIIVNTRNLPNVSKTNKPTTQPERNITPENKSELPLVKTNRTVDINSSLSNMTSDLMNYLSNRTINVTINNTDIGGNNTQILNGNRSSRSNVDTTEFKFQVDKILLIMWSVNASATPRVIVKYKNEDAVSTEQYLEALYKELESQKESSPKDFDKAELLKRKAELESVANIQNRTETQNKILNFITGNLVSEEKNNNINGSNIQTNLSIEELQKIQKELSGVKDKIIAIEIYDELQNHKRIKSLKYYNQAKIEILESNFSDIKLLRLNKDIEKIYLDKPVESLITESISLTQILETKLAYPELDGTNITICLLDTGINTEFVRNPSIGYNFINDSDNYSDDNGHGTTVGYVIYSIVPNAKLVVGKVLDQHAQGYDSGVIIGLQYCKEQNASIISLSLGSGGYNGYCDSDPVAQTVNELNSAGTLVIAATGNNGSRLVKVPACASGALAVGASKKDDTVASFTTFNGNTLLVAPGANITSIDVNGNANVFSGTSMAVSFVSAISAMLKQSNENLTPIELKNRIIHTGKIIESGNKTFSRVDGLNALNNIITNNLTEENVSGEGSSNGSTAGLTPCSNYYNDYNGCTQTGCCQYDSSSYQCSPGYSGGTYCQHCDGYNAELQYTTYGYVWNGFSEVIPSSSYSCYSDGSCTNGACSGTMNYYGCWNDGTCNTWSNAATEAIYAATNYTLTAACGRYGTTACDVEYYGCFSICIRQYYFKTCGTTHTCNYIHNTNTYGTDYGQYCYGAGLETYGMCDYNDRCTSNVYWDGLVCNANGGACNQYDYAIEPDTLSDACTCNRGGASNYWSLGGDYFRTYCCGNNVNENKVTRVEYTSDTSQFTWNSDASDDACCDVSTDCVNNSVCYAAGAVHDLNGDGRGDAECYNWAGTGEWINADYLSAWCASAGGAWDVNYSEVNADSGYLATYYGVADSTYCGYQKANDHPGTWVASKNCCCGDDSGEYARPATLGPTACCDAATDCVDAGGTCRANGYASGTYSCQGGSWIACNAGKICNIYGSYYCDGTNWQSGIGTGANCGSTCQSCNGAGSCANTASDADYQGECAFDQANCGSDYCNGAGACNYITTGMCRASAGTCDVAETCAGASSRACPGDAGAGTGQMCAADQWSQYVCAAQRSYLQYADRYCAAGDRGGCTGAQGGWKKPGSVVATCTNLCDQCTNGYGTCQSKSCSLSYTSAANGKRTVYKFTSGTGAWAFPANVIDAKILVVGGGGGGGTNMGGGGGGGGVATAMLNNPGFETGDYTGWDTGFSISSSTKHSGSYAARIYNSPGYCNNYIIKDIAVTTYTDYIISAWINANEAAGDGDGGARVGIADTGFGGWIDSGTLYQSGGWVYRVAKKNSGALTSMRFFLTVSHCGYEPTLCPACIPSGDTYFDDVTITRVSGSPTITVGPGGSGAPSADSNVNPAEHPAIAGRNGQNSVFDSVTAYGGGYGGLSPNWGLENGNSGGSGGGASGYNHNSAPLGSETGGAGTAGQGYRGGNQGNAYYSGGGGGAGGAGADGNNKANGGPGVQNSILGTSYYWGGGGGGSAYSDCSGGGNGGAGGGGGGAVGTTTGGSGLNAGSAGGGGSCNAQTNTPGGSGGANTGGGGGSGSHYFATNQGGDGGSGYVAVSVCVGCIIEGVCYDNGDNNPGNECQSCQTGTSQIAWSNKADYTDCTGTCKSCMSGTCTSIDGADWQSECAASYTCSGQTILNNDLCNGANACGDPVTTCGGTMCNYCSGGSSSCTLPTGATSNGYGTCNAYTCGGAGSQVIAQDGCDGAGTCQGRRQVGSTCGGTVCNYCSGGSSSCTLPTGATSNGYGTCNTYSCVSGSQIQQTQCNGAGTCANTNTGTCNGAEATCGCTAGSATCMSCATAEYCSSYTCTAIGTPTSFTATAQTDKPLNSRLGKVAISWGAPAGGLPSGYQYNMDWVSTSNLYDGTGTSYNHDNINDNLPYCYYVRVENPGATHYGSWTSQSCPITKDRTVPAVTKLIPGKEGLVGYWKLDEASGSTAYDSVSGSAGTISGATWTTGHTNGALNFTGSDYVTVGNMGSFPSKGTVGFWFKANVVTSYPNAFSTHMDGNKGVRFELDSTGTWGAVIGDDGTSYIGCSFGAGNVSAGVWYYTAVTWDTSTNTANCYIINSVSGIKNNSISNTYWATTMPAVTIGSGFSTGRRWNGSIDEVKIFRRALSATEVLEEYNNSKAYLSFTETDSGLKLYMPFEENTGTTTQDWSDNNNDGTITGATWATGKYGNGVSFSGAGVITAPVATTDVNDITLEAWIKPSGACSGGIVQVGGPGCKGITLTCYNTDNAVHALFPCVSWNSQIVIPTSGQWVHVAITRTGGTTKGYANGVQTTTDATTPVAVSTSDYTNIGSTEGAYNFSGVIDDVRVYNRALNQSEIVNDMQSGTIYKNISRATTGTGTYNQIAGAITANAYTDTSATDAVAPATPSSPTVSNLSTTSLNISWASVVDNGNTYYYYAKGYDTEGNENNLISSAGIESGVATDYGLSNGGGGNWAAVTSASYKGLYSLHSLVASSGDQYALINSNPGGTVEGRIFRFYAYIKTQSVSAGNMRLMTYWSNDSGWIWANNVQSNVIGGTTDWTLIEAVSTAPPGAKYPILIYAPIAKDGQGEFWIDNDGIVEVKSQTITSGVKDYYVAGSGTGGNSYYSGTSATITGLTCGTQHCYNITARDNSGNSGSTSSQACGNTSDCLFTTCGTLSTANTVYNLTQNVISTGTCFDVTAQNVTINCAGYWINYSTAGTASTYGIISTNQFNTTIKNCNIIDGNWANGNTDRHGIYFNGNSNSILLNNNVNVSNSYAIVLASSSNNNILTSNKGTSNSNTGLVLDSSSNNSLTNNTGTSDSSSGIKLDLAANNNNLTNNVGTSKSSYGIMLSSSSNVTLTSNRGVSTSGVGLWFNTLSNSTITSNIGISNSSIGLISSTSVNNVFISNSVATNGTLYGMWFNSGSTNNTIRNSTINATSGTLLVIESDSGLNKFYWNNFTSATTFINNGNNTNMFNTTVAGVPQGNIYFNIISKNVYDTNSNTWGDYGTDYPINATTWSAKWTGAGSDWGPKTTRTAVICGATLAANTIYTLISNLTSTGTCFNITVQNVTIDCAGYWINYSTAGTASTYGIRTNAFNTTIKNCNIIDGNWTNVNSNRYGIYFNGNSNSILLNNFVNVSNSASIYLNANFNTITNNNATSNSSYGIYLTVASNNNLTANRGTSNSNYGIYFSASSNNTLTNNTINSTTGISLFIDSTSGLNKIYWNNFTSGTYYINNSNSTNTFNTTNATGTPQGNYYSGIENLHIYDTNGDGWGDYGADYPINATTWSAKWIGNGTDYGPKTSRINVAPSLTNILLTSFSGYNVKEDNLSVTYTSVDSDDDATFNFTDWRRNGTSIAVLNMLFNTNISSTATGAIKDYSTYNNNGTLGGGTAGYVPNWTTAGKIGGGYSFDGVNDYIDLNTAVSFATTDSFTISAWIKTNSITVGTSYVTDRTTNTNQLIDLYRDNDDMVFRIRGSNGVGLSTVTYANVLTAGNWYHIVGVRDVVSDTIKLYVNGVNVTPVNDATTATINPLIEIGAGLGGSSSWNGSIDEVKIYNRSLSPEQIYQEYLAGLNGQSTNTLVTNETVLGDVWTTLVGSCDYNNPCATNLSNNLTIVHGPYIVSAILNATSPYNMTTDNLTLTYTVTDILNDPLYNFTDWRLNGTSIAVLNMPFNANISSTATGAIKDYSTYNNNGTLGGGTAGYVPNWTTAGKIGGGYVFDGIDDVINLGSDSSIDNMARFSGCAWVKPSSTTPENTYGIFLNKNNGLYGGYHGWNFYTISSGSGGGFGFSYWDDGSIGIWRDNQSYVVTANVWHHLCFTYSGGGSEGIKLYANGANIGFANEQNSSGFVQNDSSNDLHIGSVLGVYTFNGTVDEVKLYNRVLSPEQIYQEYLAGYNNKSTNTIVRNETARNNVWSVLVGSCDPYMCVASLSNNLTVVHKPIINSIILNSTSAQNTIADNLTLAYTASDSDNHAMYNFTDWRRNGTSIAVLNMPFNTNISSTSTGAIKDYSTNNNHGQLGGGTATPTWNNNGKIGGAYVFDGGDNITFSTITLGNGNWTMSAWVKTSGASTQPVISNVDSGPVTNLAGVDTGKISYWNYNSSGWQYHYGTILVNDSNWHHLTWVNIDNTMKMYVDGSADGSTFASVTTTGGPVKSIGRSWGAALTGSIDEVKIYNRSLSPEQIYQEYLAGYNNKSTNTIVRNETVAGDVWTTLVGVCDNDDCATNVSNNITVVEDAICNAPSGVGDWNITGNETCRNRVINVTGHIMIGSGERLELDNVTLIMNQTTINYYDIYVNAGSELRAYGGTVINSTPATSIIYVYNIANFTNSITDARVSHYVYSGGKDYLDNTTVQLLVNLIQNGAHAYTKDSYVANLYMTSTAGMNVSINGLTTSTYVSGRIASSTTDYELNYTNTRFASHIFYGNGGNLNISNSTIYQLYQYTTNGGTTYVNNTNITLFLYHNLAGVNVSLNSIAPSTNLYNTITTNGSNVLSLNNVRESSFYLYNYGYAYLQNVTTYLFYGNNGGTTYWNNSQNTYRTITYSGTKTILKNTSWSSSSYDYLQYGSITNFTQPADRNYMAQVYFTGTGTGTVDGYVNITSQYSTWAATYFLNRYFPINITNDLGISIPGATISIKNGSTTLNTGVTDSTGIAVMNISGNENTTIYGVYLGSELKQNITLLYPTAPAGIQLTVNRPTVSATNLVPTSPTINDDIIANVICTDSVYSPLKVYWKVFKNNVAQGGEAGNTNIIQGVDTNVKNISHTLLTMGDMWNVEFTCENNYTNSTAVNTTTANVSAINCGTTLVANSINTLTTNVSINGLNCFNVTANNVTIDCNGYNITGNNVTGTIGIDIKAANATIRNCRISNFACGILIRDVANSTIQNNTVSTTTTYSYPNGVGLGIGSAATTTGAIVSGNTLNGTPTGGFGLLLYGASSNGIYTNNILSGRYAGYGGALLLFGATTNSNFTNNTLDAIGGPYALGLQNAAHTGNIFTNNTLRNATTALLYAENVGSNNKFYWNNFTQTVGVYISNANAANIFNTTGGTGHPQGNIYFNITSQEVYDTDGDNWADIGTAYPISNNTWNKLVGPITEYGSWTTRINNAPVLQNSTILPSPAYTNVSLRGYCNATDADLENVTYNYKWFLNNVLNFSNVTTQNYTQGLLINVGNISNISLVVGQNWILECQANDSKIMSNRLNSTTITIQPLIPPIPALVSPSNGNNTLVERQPLLVWNSTVSTTRYEVNITSNNCASRFDNNTNIGGTTSNYTSPSELCLQTEGTNTYYNWTVRACNSQACSNWAATWNFSIQPYLAIALTTSSVSFTGLGPGNRDNTSDMSPTPITIRNDGNVLANLTNITLNQSLFTNAAYNTQYFRIMTGNTSEINSFNTTISVMNWTNASRVTNNTIINLKYNDSTDTAYMHLLVEVPALEPSGNKAVSMMFNWMS